MRHALQRSTALFAAQVAVAVCRPPGHRRPLGRDPRLCRPVPGHGASTSTRARLLFPVVTKRPVNSAVAAPRTGGPFCLRPANPVRAARPKQVHGRGLGRRRPRRVGHLPAPHGRAPRWRLPPLIRRLTRIRCPRISADVAFAAQLVLGQLPLARCLLPQPYAVQWPPPVEHAPPRRAHILPGPVYGVRPFLKPARGKYVAPDVVLGVRRAHGGDGRTRGVLLTFGPSVFVYIVLGIVISIAT